jgi:sugar phosphate isomerase/epimerase
VKIGCAAFNLVKGYVPALDRHIETIAEMGFDGIELMISSVKYLDEYYTRETVARVEKLARACKLTISQVDIGSSAIDGLASLSRDRKEESIAVFERCAAIARDVGSAIICFVSHWPEGMKAPIAYLPNYLYPAASGAAEFSPRQTMELPRGFDWSVVWENYVDSLARCAVAADSCGLKCAIESHTNTIISGTDSYLRLFDRIRSLAIGANLDTAFPVRQREYVPTAVHKLKGRLLHVHARDGDGILNANLPPGLGIVDWETVVQALEDIGYDGFLSLELSGYADPIPYLEQSREFLVSILKRRAVARKGVPA